MNTETIEQVKKIVDTLTNLPFQEHAEAFVEIKCMTKARFEEIKQKSEVTLKDVTGFINTHLQLP